MSDLMLIESPNKIKTISKYLSDKDITVFATYGHLRELSKWGFGFNTTDFNIRWDLVGKKAKIKNKTVDLITQINNLANKSKKIYLSTDPDREGEAISWHIYSILEPKNQQKCCRVVFNEITKSAIDKAMANPRNLDQSQINSYLARRLLDRYIGFKLSSYTNKKVGGSSAGRVQSIALKFLRDKDIEIKNFKEDFWFSLDVELQNGLALHFKKLAPSFSNVKLRDDQPGDTLFFAEEKDIISVKESLSDSFTLKEILPAKTEKANPPKGFETSTLLEACINKLHLNLKTAEQTLQKLYEGIKIGEDTISLITYPRTDRSDFSETFIAAAKEFIIGKYTEKYWNPVAKPKLTKKEQEKALVQGAHEGIRPTNIALLPEDVEQYLDKNQLKVYQLVWAYTVCSLMPPIEYCVNAYQFDNNQHEFKGIYKTETFDGYKLVMSKYDFQQFAQPIKLDVKKVEGGKTFKTKHIEVKKINKKPPAHYNEASLIMALKNKGIGRPSTYVMIANVVLNRQYATKESNKLLITDFGLTVSNDLEENFANFINYDYTRKMEMQLDAISEDKLDWKAFLTEIFNNFEVDLQKSLSQIPTPVFEKVDGEKCAKCDAELVYKTNKRTQEKFVACINFPKCKFAHSLEQPELEDKKCPDCSLPLVKKKNRWNAFFVACSGYPNCKYIEKTDTPAEEVAGSCPECKSNLVKKLNRWKAPFVACSAYPKCKYILSDKKVEKTGEKCELCQGDLVKKMSRWNKPFISCSNFPKCKYIKNIKTTESS